MSRLGYIRSFKFGIRVEEGIAAGLMVGLIVGLGYTVEQSDFGRILFFYGLLFGIYLLVYRFTQKKTSIHFFIGVGILLRIILVFSMPNLSDDVYRFIWDGRLWVHGFNPFEYLPSHYLASSFTIPGIDQTLFEQLNSQEYFTIYPPISQLTFATACWFFPMSLLGSTIVMKLFLLSFEIGSIYLIIKLLNQFELPTKNVLLYTLNPLIIIEIMGNLHFEGAMIFFLLLGMSIIFKTKLAHQIGEINKHKGKVLRNFFFAAFALALSIASKLLPFLFLPFFIRRLGWKRSGLFFLAIGGIILILFMPLFTSTFFYNFGESLDLYFRKFEFNASIYYLGRWLGYQTIGYNLIHILGPAFALCTLLGVSLLVFFERKPTWKNLPEKMLFAICLYLLFSATIHPWYVSLPVVLCLFTRFRFPILWSGLIMLTYINYSYGAYFENLWIVWIEYLSVGMYAIYELFFKSNQMDFADAH